MQALQKILAQTYGSWFVTEYLTTRPREGYSRCKFRIDNCSISNLVYETVDT